MGWRWNSDTGRQEFHPEDEPAEPAHALGPPMVEPRGGWVANFLDGPNVPVRIPLPPRNRRAPRKSRRRI